MAKKTYASKSDLPVTEIPDTMESRSVEWNGYQVSFITFKREFKKEMIIPIFEGLPDNMCQAPHWGYIFKGKMIVKFKDREETLNAGDAYYMEPGHVPTYVEEGTEFLEFSPKVEFDKTMAITTKNMEKMMKQKPV
jgi:hypothetical protein